MKIKEWRIKGLILFGLSGWGLLIYILITAYMNGGIAHINFNAKNELLFEMILFPCVFLFIIGIGTTHWAEVKTLNEIRAV